MVSSLLRRVEGLRVYFPPVDETALKQLAVITMLIDHITYAFLECMFKDGSPLMFSISNGKLLDALGRAIGRQAFPIFCFFLTEGFRKTHSRPAYLGRIAAFALLSQLPFQKAFFPNSTILHANVLCTLGLGLLLIWILDSFRDLAESGSGVLPSVHSPDASGPDARHIPDDVFVHFRSLFLWLACAGSVYGFCRLAEAIHCDYGYGGVLMIVLLYLFRDYRLTGLFVSWIWLSWYNNYELFSLPAFLLLGCYNGERGRQHKYFYYAFYPAHLLILWLLRRTVSGV